LNYNFKAVITIQILVGIIEEAPLQKMKSAFGSKRRPRKIEVEEEDDDQTTEVDTTSTSEQGKTCKYFKIRSKARG
jgi:hypothetical protein